MQTWIEMAKDAKAQAEHAPKAMKKHGNDECYITKSQEESSCITCMSGWLG